MWVLLALAMLSPLGWALFGAEPIGAILPGVADLLPEWLAEPYPVEAQTVAVATAVGLVLALTFARELLKHPSTLVHEMGHALTGALLGATIDRIKLHPDGSGTAHFEHSAPGRARRLAVAFSGYVAPGLVGVASVQAALAGYATLWTAYAVGLFGIMLLLTLRTWWAALVVLVLGGLGWALIELDSNRAVTIAVAGMAGSLLGSGVRSAVTQWRICRSHDCDAAHLAAYTGWPVRFFAGAHVLVAVGLAGVGIAVPLREAGLI